MQNRLPIFVALFICLISCQNTEKSHKNISTKFHSVEASHSGIDFSNNILENDTLNYYTFPYLYMGGGVAIGDINNDGLSDIFVSGNMVPNKLYLNKGNMQFEDISIAAGVNGDDRWYTGVTMVDINADGWLDIYVCVSGKHAPFHNQLYINNQDNTFSEQAQEYGIADSSTSIQATFFDYDKDGLLDLFVANYPQILVSRGNGFYYQKMQKNTFEESAHLYKNKGDGTFKDVTTQTGVQNFGLTLGVIATDFNNDGHVDLYLSNDFNVPDYFYLNNGDGTFSEKVKESTRHTSMFGMGADAGDFNNDGWMDFAQVDMTPSDHKRAKTNMASMSPTSFYQAVNMGFHYQYMQNSLQMNNGATKDGLPIFSDISRFTGMATTDWSWGIQFMDLDNNGWQDVFISNGMKRDVNNNDAIAKFKEGSFFGEETPDVKQLPSEPIANYVFKNKGDLAFDNASKEWGIDQKGFSNGFAYGDLDNDGDLDLIVNNLDAPLTLYENETKGTAQHFLQVKLSGPTNNPFGLGGKVTIEAANIKQTQELTLTRGFQSSVAPILHFGLGESTTISNLEIRWPDGKTQSLENISADQLLELTYAEASTSKTQNKSRQAFKNSTQAAGIDFLHTEDNYNDYVLEPLLPHKNSALGPAMTVGDANGDGREDFFAGNAAGRSGQLFIQDSEGSFSIQNGPWEAHGKYEETGALFLDIDNDGDQDLYVVHGGNDPLQRPDFHQDYLYLNTPNGFITSSQALPDMPISGQTVAANDFDKDGDLDLFVGGRIVPGKYPLPASSYLLRNDGGKDEKLKFTDVTTQFAPELKEIGLVTSAIWNDHDDDGFDDLIIAGEWMPITVLLNRNGTAFQPSGSPIFPNSNGWWYSLKAADIDQDGDTDYIAGNLGLNYKYKASVESPFEIFANDFDENSTLDIVLSYHKKGELLPVRGRECSSGQVPAIATRFKTYQAFAEADLPELYGKSMLKKSLNLQAQTFESCWIENKGNGDFEKHPLPHQAQLSSINAIEVIDYNGDAHSDLLIFGNLYGSEVETPRNDAGVGLVLTGNPNGQFTVVPASESGVLVPGDVKTVAPIFWGTNKKQAFLIGRNNEFLQMISLEKP